MSETRIVLTGGRSFVHDTNCILPDIMAFIDDLPIGTLIKHGGAVGFDTIVDCYLAENGWEPWVSIERPDYGRFPAHYAPIARNEAMVDWAKEGSYSILIAMWYCKANLDQGGTGRTIKYALEKEVDNVIIYRYGQECCT